MNMMTYKDDGTAEISISASVSTPSLATPTNVEFIPTLNQFPFPSSYVFDLVTAGAGNVDELRLLDPSQQFVV